MRYAVYATPFRSKDIASQAAHFIRTASRDGNYIILAQSTVDAFKDCGIDISDNNVFELCSSSTVPDGCDFIISLGGDGTFLRAAHWSGQTETPVVGVNLGHLGYLTAFGKENLESLTCLLQTGDFDIESRSMLRINVEGGIPHTDCHQWLYALNEVAILKQDTASMIYIPVKLNGKELGVYNSDGLIISTPTGSTAYNLSVGGPVLEPTVHALTISPIADHSLTMRPLVINDTAQIEVTAIGRISSFRVSLDGNSFVLDAGTKILINKAPFVCRMVCTKGRLFASTLRSKLLWGELTFKP